MAMARLTGRKLEPKTSPLGSLRPTPGRGVQCQALLSQESPTPRNYCPISVTMSTITCSGSHTDCPGSCLLGGQKATSPHGQQGADTPQLTGPRGPDTETASRPPNRGEKPSDSGGWRQGTRSARSLVSPLSSGCSGHVVAKPRLWAPWGSPHNPAEGQATPPPVLRAPLSEYRGAWTGGINLASFSCLDPPFPPQTPGFSLRRPQTFSSHTGSGPWLSATGRGAAPGGGGPAQAGAPRRAAQRRGLSTRRLTHACPPPPPRTPGGVFSVLRL